MTHETASPAGSPVQFERSYDAPLEDLWALWTTKEGFEAWWGPEGFRVEVHAIDPRVGGELCYDMIAVGEDQIRYMKGAGRPLSHPAHCTFAELEPLRHLKLRTVIDFIPGVEPYTNDILVEFFPEGNKVRMLVTIAPFHSDELTRLSAQGFESQLTKLPAALGLAGRR